MEHLPIVGNEKEKAIENEKKKPTTSCYVQVHVYLVWHVRLMLFSPFLTTIAFSMSGNLSAKKTHTHTTIAFNVSCLVLLFMHEKHRNDMKATHIPCLSMGTLFVREN